MNENPRASKALVSMERLYTDAITSALKRAHGRGVSRDQLVRYVARRHHSGDVRAVDRALVERTLKRGMKSRSFGTSDSRRPLATLPRSVARVKQRVGMHTDIGDREYQEDRVATLHDADRDVFAAAVFDGHCGEGASSKLCSNRSGLLAALLDENNGDAVRALPPQCSRSAAQRVFKRYDAALKRCVRADADGDYPGSTATVIARRGGALALYNVGDSRTVVYDGQGTPLSSSVDHNPETPRECRRVLARGGRVEFDDNGPGCFRVDGYLNMARAFGDYSLKRNGKVTARPDVFVEPLPPGDVSYAVLASDGVWDAMSNGDVGRELVRSIASQRRVVDDFSEIDLDAVAKDIVRRAIATSRRRQPASADNTTALVIQFVSRQQ